jgi:hypothetical protein
MSILTVFLYNAFVIVNLSQFMCQNDGIKLILTLTIIDDFLWRKTLDLKHHQSGRKDTKGATITANPV